MAFTADVYNSAVNDPESFVQKNILNEVEEMVSGLEKIQSASSYRMQESFFNPNSIMISGDDMVRFKGEKISGALGFLDQLQTLAPITDKVGSYIERIMNCNFSVVAELENGLDTDIGERGMLLSGGQKQRVAIARAFLKNAPIVVLDEATSALDNKSEAVVQKAIENLMHDKTVFVIAHRLSTIRNATKIIVVNDGKIVESGSHEELLKMECGAYKTLYDMQFKTKEDK